jgi:FkbM family methyltransferase
MSPILLPEHDTDFNQLSLARDGYFLYNKHDIYIGQAIYKYGEFSHLEMEVLKQLCQPGHIVIEVGANIGAHTVGLAKHIGDTGRLFAFEPQRIVFQTLCANIALNNLINVECYWAALSEEKGSITVPEINPRQAFNFGGVTLLQNKAGLNIPTFKLDEFIGLPHLQLIKIDVEGMESNVLKGGTELIKKFKPILYVENDRIDKSEALMRLINHLGYNMFWHRPPLFNPDNFCGETENIYPNIASFNLLCTPKQLDINLSGFEKITDFSKHPLQ